MELNVTRWERGTAKPSAFYMQKRCELFGKTASEMGLLPPPPPQFVQEAETGYGQKIHPTPAPAERQSLWNVPFRRNPFFTGRAQPLTTLHDQLTQNRSATLTQSQALTGLGGIGKTQTAIEYAYRYRDEYRAVFWVRAASGETLIADFVALAHLLELPGQDAQDEMQVVLKDGLDEEMRRQWAERTVKALNVTFPEVSFATWPHCERCLPHVHACKELIELHRLSFPEAAHLLDQAGYYLYERGLYEQAEPFYQRALRIREQSLEPEHPETAQVRADYAELCLYRVKV